MSLEAHAVSLRRGGRFLLDRVSLELRPGELHAVLGANGAGKSSLLRVLAGEWTPHVGDVRLNGRPMRDWTLPERARQRAVLPQDDELRFGFTAEEVVGLGRLAVAGSRPADDATAVRVALVETGTLHLATRDHTTLSGGERQRVQLARVLAQLTADGAADLHGRYLLLDEPTAALDLAHQHAFLSLARARAARGAGVLVVLHDINLAAQYADRISLLGEGRLIAQGGVAEVLTAEHLRNAFGSSLRFQPLTGPRGLRIEVETGP